jgi:hypothetical protein
MIVLDSFLKFSKQNEELRLVRKFENLYRTKFMSESHRSIWSLLLLEFRRFVLDFAETKKHEDINNITLLLKQAGEFEEKRDKCFF